MRWATVKAVFAVLGIAAMSACGGGGGGSPPPQTPAACQGSFAIDTPTYADTWETDQALIEIGGWAPTPGGPYSGNCPGDPGYTMTWRNEGSGDAGLAFAWTSKYYGVLGPYCSTRWSTSEIALIVGDNRIRVSGGTALGEACILVKRLRDTTPPRVSWTSPTDGAVNVPVTASITVYFNEPMDRTSVTTATFVLRDQQGAAVTGSVAVDASGRTATFVPSAPLAYPRTYTATVTTGVRDATGGNALAADWRWSFSTGAVPDTAPPVVNAVDPPAGSACMATLGTVSATFDEPIDPLTLSASTFVLRDAHGTPVSARVSYAQQTARLQPTVSLSGDAPYTATLTTGIKDLAGNALAADYAWTFRTGAEAGAWQRTTTASSPYPRSGHFAVWTGAEMIVAGGFAYLPDWNRFEYTSTGARYDPASDTWRAIAPNAPARMNGTAVWTGAEMLVWGGTDYGGGVAAGAAYNPAIDAWRALPTAGAPASAAQHTAVWTGSEMIVWGGVDAAGRPLASGARYDPATNTWRPMTSIGAPTARARHTAVWTGAEMIVWGGSDGTSDLATGARYDPVADAWTPIAAANAPSARVGHTAVWTGAQMIVWGSRFGTTNSGGRYSPATDTWQPTSTLCAPSGREGHVAVWTGTKMLVWGGYSGAYAQYYVQGAAYDPAGDTWQAMSATDAPAARFDHSGVWTGSRFVVWGGRESGTFNTGGRFAP
jgi:N-acetylneuraminic acid mutarotase